MINQDLKNDIHEDQLLTYKVNVERGYKIMGMLEWKEWSTKEIAATIIFGAAVAASTAAIQIPVPTTQGYINLGDTMVMTAALLFGWRVGLLAGGIGSAMADVVTGYPQWALFTLVIKGLEGLLVGALRSTPADGEDDIILGYLQWRNILAVIIGGIVMVTGYFIVELFWYGYGDAAVELPGNLFQAVSAMILSLLITTAVRKAAPELLLEEEEVS